MCGSNWRTGLAFCRTQAHVDSSDTRVVEVNSERPAHVLSDPLSSGRDAAAVGPDRRFLTGERDSQRYSGCKAPGSATSC